AAFVGGVYPERRCRRGGGGVRFRGCGPGPVVGSPFGCAQNPRARGGRRGVAPHWRHAPGAPRGAPHWGQNLEALSASAPHVAQVVLGATAVPHSGQNLPAWTR